jgi:phosphatidylglycerol:prolipoprotein diacylglycerol transferase
MEEILLRELFRIPTPLGDFPVFGYGAMVLLGVLSGLWLLRAGARRSKLDPDSLSDLTVMLVLCGIIGGRVWYLIQFRERVYADGDWIETFRLWNGGLVLYGAIAGGLVGFYLLQRRHSYAPWRQLLDLIAPALALGIAFGRIGCFFNGCCFGGVCPADWPLAAIFPPGSPPSLAHGDGLHPSPTLHPTQIYSSIQGAILALLLWFAGGPLAARPGRTFALFLGLYSIGRSLVESIRGDHGVAQGEWTVSQWASIAAFALALWLWNTAPFIEFQSNLNKRQPDRDQD